VLVRGGWADSSGWDGEISRLDKAGYAVISPANPLRGLTSDADYVWRGCESRRMLQIRRQSAHSSRQLTALLHAAHVAQVCGR
jgi:hypothetical protein